MKIELTTVERERLLSGLGQEENWWQDQMHDSSRSNSVFSKNRHASAKIELEKTQALIQKLNEAG